MKQVSPERQRAWEILAQAWVDTSYDENQLAHFTRDLISTGLSVSELRRIAYLDVCGAFAIFSTAVVASAGMVLPDWDYPADEARDKTARWISRPFALSLFNPVWLAGYPISVAIMRSTMGPVLSAVARATSRLAKDHPR